MNEEEKDEGIHDIISDIREEFLSDLNPEEIPNSDISEISDTEIVANTDTLVEHLEKDQNIENKIEMAKKNSEQAIEKNH